MAFMALCTSASRTADFDKYLHYFDLYHIKGSVGCGFLHFSLRELVTQ